MGDSRVDKSKRVISRALEDKLAVKPGDLRDQIRKSTKYVPPRVRKDVDYIFEAEAQLKNPKMRKRVDFARIDRAERDVLRNLDRANPREDRITSAYFWGAGLVINLILAMAVIFLAAKWLGAY